MRLTIINKIVFLLSLMLAVAIANVGTIYYYQTQRIHDTHIVNVAGGQRMLSEKIVKYALAVSSGDDKSRRRLEETIQEYGSSLKALRYGGKAMGEYVPAAPSIMEGFFQRNSSIWKPFKEKVEIVISEKNKNLLFSEASSYIRDENDVLLKVSDDVVKAYEDLPNVQNYIHEINVAGRQRMLSQKMAKYAFLIVTGEDAYAQMLKESIELYDKSFLAMSFGGVSIPWGKEIRLPPPSVRNTLNINKEVWSEFKARINIIQKRSRYNANFRKAIEYIKRHNDDLFGISSLIAHTFDEMFSRKTIFLRVLLLAMLGMDILFFIIGCLIAVKIVKPLKALSAAAIKVGAGDFTAKAPIATKDEIGDLATSFNKMTENLQETTVSRDYVDTIVKSMIDTLIVVNPEANIKTVNKATLDLLGYKQAELIGKSVATIIAGGMLFKGTRLKKLIEEGWVRDYDITYKTKLGEKIPMSFSASIMLNCEHRLAPMDCPDYQKKKCHCIDKFIGIVCIARDMREIKHLMQKEKELAAAAADVEKKRAEELDGAYTRLKNKTQSLERFHKVTVGRELEMVKLKEEINILLEKSGQPKKYETPEKIKGSRERTH